MLPTGMAFTSGGLTSAPTVAGYYVVTATAADTSTTPITGSVNFLVDVTAAANTLTTMGLTLDANSNPLIRPSTYGVPNANVTQVLPVATAPYSFLMMPNMVPGLAIDPATGIVSTSYLTPAGVYVVVVTVTDSAATPLTNTISFPVTVLPALSSTNGESVTGTAASASASLTTIQPFTGNSLSSFTYTGLFMPQYMSVSASGVISTSHAITAGTYYVGVNVSDATLPANGSAGGSANIYIAVTLK
jgi:hypothetical protein